MLQQTRVDTVMPYYARFLERFPTVQALAEADEGAVLSAWSGLGYYRRARFLHAGARHVSRLSALPRGRDEWLTVPGVGPYTAGAIASIAFGEAAPLVDGNVARVLARIFGLEDDVKSTRGMKAVWAVAERELRREDPGAWNQALMELGATVCTPKSPACEACPVRPSCRAFAEERVGELPVVGKKAPPKDEPSTALVLVGPGGVLLGERRSEGRFGGLWEPPRVMGHLEPGEASVAFRAYLGPRAPDLSLSYRANVVHVLSHRKMDVKVYSARTRSAIAAGSTPAGDYTRFGVRPHEERSFSRGMSRLALKVLEAAGIA
jgi:A/G-specific adenine glycosylase